MGQKLDCDTIRDLFPTYIEKITSETSNLAIEEHLKECEECRTILNQMNQEIAVEAPPEVQNFKHYLNRSKGRFAYTVIEILSCIAIITCTIVNLAVDHYLSWSLIVDASIISLLLVMYTGFHEQKHRFIKMTAVANICTFLLLGVIQIVLHSIMKNTDIWFFKYALPITLLWTAAIWFSIVFSRIFKINILNSIAVFVLLCIPGTAFTNIIAGEYSGINDYFALHFVSNGLGSLIIAIILFVTGTILPKKKKPPKF